MFWVLTLWLWLLLLPSLLVILIPLVENLFSIEFFDFIDQIMSWLDFIIWSNNVNYFFQVLAIIMFFLVFRWIIRAISSFK